MPITPNDPADFTPARGSYKELSPFRFWCQKVLPLVYDDSLSYYELLNKVVQYLNMTMEDVTTLEGDVTNLHTAYVQLQTYVNDYFVSLDVQQEIDNKLDEMASSGELTNIISPFIPDIVTAWLNEHVTPTTPIIDDTLTISGAGADAKVVGDRLNEINTDFNELTNGLIDNASIEIKGTLVRGSFDPQGLPIESNNNYRWSEAQKASKNINVKVNEGYRVAVLYYENQTGTSITASPWITTDTRIAIPDNANYINVRVQTVPISSISPDIVKENFSVYGEIYQPLKPEVNNLSSDLDDITEEANKVKINISGDILYRGITYTPSDEGYINMNGTNVDSTTVALFCEDITLPAGEYMFGSLPTIPASGVFIQARDWTGGRDGGYVGATASVQKFILDTQKVIRLRLQVNASVTVNNVRVYPILTKAEDFPSYFIKGLTAIDYIARDKINNLEKTNQEFLSLLSPSNSARWLFAKGKSWSALGNTVEAYTLAGQDERCWGINGDCQYTADDQLVMWHDTTIPYNGNNVYVNTLTLSQILTIEITEGGHTYHVPTLDEFIAICRRYGKVCNIELKGRVGGWAWVTNGKSALLDTIVNKLTDLGMVNSSFIGCVATDINYLLAYHNIMCVRYWDANVGESTLNTYINEPRVIHGGYASAWASENTMITVHRANRKGLVYTQRPQTINLINQAIGINGDIIGIEIDPDQ